MLDDAYRVTFRHFGTFFLVAAVLIVPLQLIHAFFFKDVIAMAGLHDAIRALPEGRDVRGITADDIGIARAVAWVVIALEVLFLPVLAAVTKRALRAEEGGHTDGVLSHWFPLAPPLGFPPLPVLAAGIAIALIVALPATWAAGSLGAVFTGDMAWVAAGLGTAAAHCLAAPFLLVPWACAKGEGPT